MAQRMDVMVARENNGKTYWTRIGVAFANAQGGWRVTLEALPLNGQLHLFPAKERAESPSIQQRQGTPPAGDVPRYSYPADESEAPF